MIQSEPDKAELPDDPIHQRVTDNDLLQDMLLKYGYTFDADDIKGIKIRQDVLQGETGDQDGLPSRTPKAAK